MADAPSLSLLSLSFAAAQSEPLPAPPAIIHAESNLMPQQSTIGSAINGKLKARRLSSASQTRRRMSDAREAGIRNSQGQSIANLSTAAAALSLSSSPPPPAGPTLYTMSAVFKKESSGEPIIGPIASSVPATSGLSSSITAAQYHPPRITTHPSGHQSLNGTLSVGALEELPPPSATITGSKKKGTIFRCESCSKVYRHPSCLVKHRWEHSPHWKEANKFLLSKHQQVQLLEAAAILSHISPTAASGGGGPATSLPDDRSLWPSYLASYVATPTSVKLNSSYGNTVLRDEMRDYADVEDDEEGDEEAIDEEEDGYADGDRDGDDLEMDFNVQPTSSSVPSAAWLRATPSTPVPISNQPYGSTRNRSRSRSVSKSIHSHVLMSVRGSAKIKKIGSEGGDEALGATPPTLTTLRPGLIGIPTGLSAPVPSEPVAQSNRRHDIWNIHRSSPATASGTAFSPSSWVSVSPAPVATKPTPAPTTTRHASPYSSYAASASLSLPRSSMRSSSSFTEADEPESFGEDNFGEGEVEESSGSSAESSKKRDKKSSEREDEWDGMEMDMEM